MLISINEYIISIQRTLNHLQVEAVLSVSPYVDNIMVHANSFHSYCVALVVPSQSAVESWALQKGIAVDDFTSLCGMSEIVKEVYGSLVKVTIYIIMKANWVLISLTMTHWTTIIHTGSLTNSTRNIHVHCQ